MINLGSLQKVELREIWASESSNFTPWLARPENLKLLGDTIGIELDLDSQEKEVGPFRCDIVCKDAEGRVVVIENQIEWTDHSHLGQVLTYAAGLDAAIVVWIAQEFTEEHRAALDWLNEKANNNIGFFGIEIEAWKIGDSAAAPKFNIVAKPNKWSNRVKQSVREGGLSETEQFRIKYWTALIEFLKTKGSSFQCADAAANYWLRVKSPIQSCRCGFEMSTRDQYVDAYFGTNNEEKVKILRKLYLEQKEEIEREIGGNIEWSDNEESGRFWICAYRETDPSNVNEWPQQHEWLKQALEKLTKILSKHLAV